ncbi:helix-turn-helix domain-containing protein [Actinosynnema sp. CS-041913]|uniref:helix-turn-helix domain-containing protein n=1 Tax=Actinosynnema sp. CS-041913 TaxID=3239917 RepID=UPI003D8D17DB
MTLNDIQPESAHDVAEFVSLLRLLKQHSGRTLRQLEEKAAEQNSVLPRSTVADMLRGTGLPRPELLAAFVRACDDERRLAQWLRVRERLAVDPHLAPRPADTAPDRDHDPAGDFPRWGARAIAASVGTVLAAIVLLLAVVNSVRTSSSDMEVVEGRPAPSVTSTQTSSPPWR